MMEAPTPAAVTGTSKPGCPGRASRSSGAPIACPHGAERAPHPLLCHPELSEARPQSRDLGSVFLVPRSLRCARKPPSVGMTEVASVGGFRLLLVVLRDVVVDAIRERELAVQVTGVWIVGILDDLEV